MQVVRKWLEEIGLNDVFPKFVAAGCVTPEALAELDPTMFGLLGVTRPEDRRKLFFLVQRIKLTIEQKKHGKKMRRSTNESSLPLKQKSKEPATLETAPVDENNVTFAATSATDISIVVAEQLESSRALVSGAGGGRSSLVNTQTDLKETSISTEDISLSPHLQFKRRNVSLPCSFRAIVASSSALFHRKKKTSLCLKGLKKVRFTVYFSCIMVVTCMVFSQLFNMELEADSSREALIDLPQHIRKNYDAAAASLDHSLDFETDSSTHKTKNHNPAERNHQETSVVQSNDINLTSSSTSSSPSPTADKENKTRAGVLWNPPNFWRNLFTWTEENDSLLDDSSKSESPDSLNLTSNESRHSEKFGDELSSSFSSFSPQLIEVVPNRCDAPSREHFDDIYKTAEWGFKMKTASEFYGNAEWPPPKHRAESASGFGSNLGEATKTSLKIIKDTIQKFNVTSMIDVPCGDVNWILDSWETDTLPLYVGLDVTSTVIEVNKQRFSHHNNKQFYFWDATSCTLPKYANGTKELQSFDLVHVRDVIQHLPLAKGIQYFCNIFKSGARVLVTTTFDKRNANKEINEGDFYHNNLWEHPFSFPRSSTCIPTHPKIEADLTCIYNLEDPWVQSFISSKCNPNTISHSMNSPSVIKKEDKGNEENTRKHDFEANTGNKVRKTKLDEKTTRPITLPILKPKQQTQRLSSTHVLREQLKLKHRMRNKKV